MLQLSAFPEELLETVLSYCVVAPLSLPPRQSSSPTSRTSSQQIRTRLAILLVSKRFCRICTPLFYHTIHIRSPKQLHCLLADALSLNPFLATCIRRIVIGGVWAEAGELLQLCSNNLRLLDITLDTSLALTARLRDLDAEDFCRGLFKINSLTHIVVRKPGNVYLTQSKPVYVLSQLAKAVEGWDQLEHADLAFRLSDDSGGAVGSLPPGIHPRKQPGPITQLTQALSIRPKLHTFSTSIPNVWNDNILRVSQNPALEHIILVDGAGTVNLPRGLVLADDDFHPGHPSDFISIADLMTEDGSIASTGHFLIQAKKHGRLSELIRAGTSSIIRTRAQTLGTPSAGSSSSSSSNQTLTTCHPAVLSHDDRLARPRSISSSLTPDITPAPSPRNSFRNSWVYYLSSPASALASLAQISASSAL